MAQLTIKVNGKDHSNVIQAYLPTSSHTDEDVDIVYKEIDNVVTNEKAHYGIVMGGFNAKVGSGNKLEPRRPTGPYGLGTRNTRGDSLVNFTERHYSRRLRTRSLRRGPAGAGHCCLPMVPQTTRSTSSSQASRASLETSKSSTASAHWRAVTIAWYEVPWPSIPSWRGWDSSSDPSSRPRKGYRPKPHKCNCYSATGLRF